LEPAWAEALSNLIRIAHDRFDAMSAVAAIRELGKLLFDEDPRRLAHAGPYGIVVD